MAGGLRFGPVTGAVLAGFLAVGHAAGAPSVPVRVVTWNINADTGSTNVDGPGSADATAKGNAMATVLEGIANSAVGPDGAVPLSVISLEENTVSGPTNTAQSVANSLNYYYAQHPGSGASYGVGPAGSVNGGVQTSGNGPNAIVYNAAALTLVGSVGVGTPTGSVSGGGNGEYRQVMRYQFRPAGAASAGSFYVYVAHSKSSASGTATDDQNDRNGEATLIHNDAATLAGAAILYSGDFNFDSSTEPAYTTLTSGTNRGTDPLNNSFAGPALTESATNLRYRDDFQFMTPNVYAGTGPLAWVNGTYETFGNNNGTVSTAYPFSTATDHLPVVSDYALAVPEPAAAAPAAVALAALLASRRRRARAPL